jgi:hypothetical protein
LPATSANDNETLDHLLSIVDEFPNNNSNGADWKGRIAAARRARFFPANSAVETVQHCRGQRPAIPPERDQEKWPSGFPAKSRDQPRIQSGHRTVLLPPEVIPLWSAIRKSGLPVFL